ncbi:heterokaryon incompatibility protein-domain-containing protein [Xylaria grammica]|nr:heterokaryon incompatibility protein-domain-containing protein [Xylaria grammica]
MASDFRGSCNPSGVLYPKNLGYGQIRLLKLLPGNWADNICCQLFTVQWDHEFGWGPEYTALSYAWGFPGREPSRILVNDDEVEIWPNLECALRDLRLPDRLFLLWVDALCINQKNDEERSSQVGLMRDIYAHATRVVVYLGPGPLLGCSPKKRDLGNNVAFENDSTDDSLTTNRLSTWRTPSRKKRLTAIDVFCLLSILARPRNLSNPFEALQGIAETTLTAIFEALRLMLTVRWWDRIWVVQEVVAARTVIVKYGNASAPWTMLVNVAKVGSWEALSKYTSSISSDDTKVLRLFSRVIDIDRFRQAWRDGQRPSLLALLRDFSYRGASDDRDRIYGLLGLCTHHTIVNPDYSLDVKEAYILAAIECIQESRSLSALGGDLSRKIRSDLPSWVPDWSATFDESDRIRADLVDLYNACSGTVSIIGSNQHHILEGYNIDHVRLSLLGTSYELIYEGMLELTQSLETVTESVNLLPQCIAFGLRSYKTGASEPIQKLCEKLIGFCHPEGRRGVTSLMDVYLGTSELGSIYLGMPAKSIGKVAQVFEPLYSSNDMNAVSKTIIAWAEGVRLLVPWEQADHDKRVAFVTTLVSGIKKTANGFERLSAGDIPALMDWFKKRILEKTTPALELEPGVESLDSFTEVLRISTNNRRFFISDDGAMGLGPKTMRKLDEIYILPGGKVPFVLRDACPQRDSSIRSGPPYEFRLLGGCFLQGVMDGYGNDPSKHRPPGQSGGSLPGQVFTKPRCQYCEKRQLECSYVPVAPRRRPKTSTPAATSNQDVPAICYPVDSSKHRFDMRLMYHYATATAPSLIEAFQPEARVILALQASLPNLAFEHDFVMDAVLFLAILHLGSEEGGPSLSMPPIVTYQGQALRSLRSAVSEASPLASRAITAASVLLALTSLATDRLLGSPGLWVARWLALKSGPRIFMSVHASATGEAANQHDSVALTARQHPAGPSTPMAVFPDLLKALSVDVGLEDPDSEAALTQAAACIGKFAGLLTLPLSTSQIGSQVRRWSLALESKRYLDLLRASNPRALIILAYYLVFMQYLPCVWLFKDAAFHDMELIRSLLGPDWQQYLAVPCAALDLSTDKEAMSDFIRASFLFETPI